MKKLKITLMLLVTTALVGGSGAFYQSYAHAAESVKESFVSQVTFDAAKTSQIKQADLVKATHLDQVASIKEITVKKQAFMEKLTPGIYSVSMTVTTSYNRQLNKLVNVRVIDSQGPVIKMKKQPQIVQGEKLEVSRFFEAQDKVSGAVPEQKMKIEDFKANQIGKQAVKVVAEDRAGNQTIKETTVEVKAAPKQASEQKATTTPAVPETGTSVAETKEAAKTSATATETAVKTAQEEQTAETQVAPTQKSEAQTAETQAVAAAPAKQQVAAKVETPKVTTNLIEFGGTAVSFYQANGSGAAPENGAATWMGTGSTTDGAPTHFIGHNPGDFSGVMNLTVGSAITVYDSQGNSRTYYVYEVMDVTDDGYNANNLKDDVYPRMLYAGGERISLQTCITETVNRCVLAR